jgi:hypothetical protein
MMQRVATVVLSSSILGVAYAQDTGEVPGNPGFFILLANLDPALDDDYCWDVVGGSAESGDRMQAHSCHNRLGPAGDQQFTSDYPSLGNIYVTQADLCVQARRLRAGSDLFVTECSSSSSQVWVSSSDGRVHPADDTSLCVTVERGMPDGIDLYNRHLTLETCADFSTRLTAWSIPGGSVGV